MQLSCNRSKMNKRILYAFALIFVFINLIAFFHAYKFTHFAENNTSKTKSQVKLSPFEKAKTLLFGISNPRPENYLQPQQTFETVALKSNVKLESWIIKTENAKGTFILFHGYGGKKSSMLDKSDEILKLGYNTFLIDFMGSGGSEGNRTTIGFEESMQVKTAYDYIAAQGESNIYLFGTSMGAAAVLKSLHDYSFNPSGIIIECPFGSLYEAVCVRFENMGVPVFPMAGLLTFWGGVQNGFWAFEHNPSNYAKKVSCPTLLLYGELDEKVKIKETNAVYENLRGKKHLKTYPLSGHDNYLTHYREEWAEDIKNFLEAY